MATSWASLAATSAIGFSTVLRPLREPSRGLTSRRASYVVSCTMGTSRSRARSVESSLSAMPSPRRRRSSAGVTSTIPTRDFASPLSISRSNDVPRRPAVSCLTLGWHVRNSRSLRQFPAGAIQFLGNELFVGKDGLILGGKDLVGEIVECVVGLGSSLFGAQNESDWRVLAGLHPVLAGVVQVHVHLPSVRVAKLCHF